MSATDRYSIYGVHFDKTADVKIGGITQSNLNLGAELANETASGMVNPEVAAIRRIAPRFTATSYSVAALLDELGNYGAAVSSTSDVTAMILYAYKHAQGSTRSASADHRVFTMAQGMVVPRQLQCQHGQDATLSMEGFATFDGSNAPIAVAAGSIVSGFEDSERFGLGPVTIGSQALNAALTGVLTGMTIDFGITEVFDGGGGDIYNTHVSILTAVPVITFQASNIAWFDGSVVPITGLKGTHANSTLYLRKRDLTAAGAYVSDVTEEHISITVAGVLDIQNVIDGAPGQAAGLTARMTLEHDGTNAPLVIDTTAALP